MTMLRRASLALLAFAAPALVSAQAISERTYKYIERVQNMMEQEKHADALAYLERVEQFDMTDYDTAVVAQAKGEVLATLERYLDAAYAFEQALLLDALGDRQNQQLRLSVGQLFINEEQYEKGVAYLEEWIAHEDDPRAQVLITMATAYSKLKRFAPALEYVERAIRAADEPRLSWYDLWIALHFNQDNIDACIDVLNEVIARFPNEKKYWKYLSSMYLTRDEANKALAVLDLAYQRGFVTDAKEIIHLAKLYLFEDVPVKAGQLLMEALEKGQIEANEKNYRLLADCWYKSQEFDRAKTAFAEAGERADDGEHDLYRAQMHLDSEEYVEAIDALERAIAKGIKQEANAVMMLAMAQFALERYDDAIATLQKASSYEKVSDQSEQWIAFVKEERARRAEYASLLQNGN